MLMSCLTLLMKLECIGVFTLYVFTLHFSFAYTVTGL
jgi:hypothetical protein